MGQKAHPGRAGLRAALVATAGLALGSVLTGCGGSLAAAPTTLAGVIGVQVLHTDGSTVAGVNGLRLRPGDVVRTGPTGRAELHTRGRVVYVGSSAAIDVINGASADLRHGAAVIDAQHGPALALTLADYSVSTPAGSAVRAERAVSERVATLAGVARVSSSTGGRLTVPALSQAMLSGDALPDSTTNSPLRLTDDDGEAHAVPALVRDDLALNALAAGIDATGNSTVHTVTVAWRHNVDPLPAGVADSEQVLPVVIAAAGPAPDASQHYQQAVQLRQDGGSWGVIAHRLGASSAAVLSALTALERGLPAGKVGSVSAALSFLSNGNAASRTGGHSGSGGSANGGGSGSGGGSGQPSGQPTPSPSPSSSDEVTSTIDNVLTLLPTPLPTPTAILHLPVPGVSVPVLPLPSVSVPAVGGLSTP